MSLGRPPLGVEHVDRLEGPEETKECLKVLLKTLTGEMTTLEACDRLGVGATRLRAMRQEMLAGALGALAPGRPGRPAKTGPASSREAALEAKVKGLTRELGIAFARTELALAMPHVLKGVGKKKSRRRGVRGRGR